MISSCSIMSLAWKKVSCLKGGQMGICFEGRTMVPPFPPTDRQIQWIPLTQSSISFPTCFRFYSPSCGLLSKGMQMQELSSCHFHPLTHGEMSGMLGPRGGEVSVGPSEAGGPGLSWVAPILQKIAFQCCPEKPLASNSCMFSKSSTSLVHIFKSLSGA